MKTSEVALVVPIDPAANATDLLLDRVTATPDAIMFALPIEGGWAEMTAAEFHAQVIALAKGFIGAGLKPGDRVALMSKTRYEWTLIDFAAWFAGIVLVPIYETSSPSQVEWILADSGAVGIVVESDEHAARFSSVSANLPYVRTMWVINEGGLDKLRAEGKNVDDAEVERRRSIAQGKDIATLIYTSGSTGQPKGCVLTHSNFVELTRNTLVALGEVINPQASTLLFIPIAHVFARFISVLCVAAGARVGHQPDTKQLVPSLQSFKPSFLLAVPRVFEKVYNSAEQKAESEGKGKIFHAAAATAVDYSKAQEAGHVPFGLGLKYKLFNKLVYGKLRAAMGGNVKHAVSGSAPLGSRLGHFYNSLGIEILEGYGLTETTAPASVNRPGAVKIGTVGPAMPGVTLGIADDGEVLVKGINVFDGYWNNPKATAESFDGEWFKTGDIGSLDEDGYLTITGRKKEILITAGGKNVAPAYLEDPIRSDPLVGQVVVVGDRKPFISALITLDPEMLPLWLTNNKLDPQMSLTEAAALPQVRAQIQAAVDRANKRVSQAESIRKFTILPIEFTEESGHLTPKLSIKRHVIMTDFATEIEGMYTHESQPGDEG